MRATLSMLDDQVKVQHAAADGRWTVRSLITLRFHCSLAVWPPTEPIWTVNGQRGPPRALLSLHIAPSCSRVFKSEEEDVKLGLSHAEIQEIVIRRQRRYSVEGATLLPRRMRLGPLKGDISSLCLSASDGDIDATSGRLAVHKSNPIHY